MQECSVINCRFRQENKCLAHHCLSNMGSSLREESEALVLSMGCPDFMPEDDLLF